MAITAFLVLVVVLIVIGVKLHHRNLELDDLYDEYGIDLDEEEAVPAKGQRQKQRRLQQRARPAVRKPVQEGQSKTRMTLTISRSLRMTTLTILEKKQTSKKNMTKWIMRKTMDLIMTAMNLEELD